VEQTGADVFTKRAMGVAAGTSVLTRADGDSRYATGLGSPTPGTSGGVPYYDSTTTLASSGLLSLDNYVIGGGAGAAPRTSMMRQSGGVLLTGVGVSTSDCGIEVGGDRTGSGAAYVDLHTTASTDFELRLSKQSGINGTALLGNVGTGSFQIQNAAGVQVQGTNTNDSAAAGYVGQIISSNITTPLGLTAGAPANLTNVALTAGDWDVEGAVRFNGAGTISDTFAIISRTSGDTAQSDFSLNTWSRHTLTYAAGATPTEAVPVLRLSLSAASTTVYLVVYCNFTSTCTAIGILRARRMR
jgi:hypothetical protein